MAITTIQIHVSSVASNGDYSGKVVKGWETFSILVKGESVTKKRLWTAWLENTTNAKKDDVVEIIGELGTKAGTFEKDGQTYNTVEHSLNRARLNIIHLSDPSKNEVPAVAASADSPF